MSKSVTPRLQECARLLLDYEATAKPSDAKGAAAFRVCEKLRGPLGKLMGADGFRSLLARALVLAGAKIPWLLGLHVQTDGSLEGLDDLAAKPDGDARALGEILLVSQLLGLLVTFIGSASTLRLLHEIWPKIDDLAF